MQEPNPDTLQVVLASGQIVNANPNSHPDLFAALKGGTNNFGIVTSFDMRVFQQGKVCLPTRMLPRRFHWPNEQAVPWRLTMTQHEPMVTLMSFL